MKTKILIIEDETVIRRELKILLENALQEKPKKEILTACEGILKLLQTFTDLNRRMEAAILMVTHDAFSASYCSRILFLKDGRIFHELVRGEKNRRIFRQEILDVLSLTGGVLTDE